MRLVSIILVFSILTWGCLYKVDVNKVETAKAWDNLNPISQSEPGGGDLTKKEEKEMSSALFMLIFIAVESSHK